MYPNQIGVTVLPDTQEKPKAKIEFLPDSGVKENEDRVVVQTLGNGFVPGTVVKMVANITKVARDNYESFLLDGVHRVNDDGQIASQLSFPFTPDNKVYYDFGVSARVVGVCQVKQHMVIVETPLLVFEVPGNM